MVDTHTHIYEPEFEVDLLQTVSRAEEAGVDRFVFPAIDSESYGRMMDVASILEGKAFPCIGLHPTSVNDRWKEELAFVEKHLDDRKWTAIGEIGLDGHWSQEFMNEQVTVFKEQMEMAYQKGWPVIIHVRDATEELFVVLKDLIRIGRMPRGVFHAFSGSFETYLRLKTYGDFLFGIGGVVTYKNAQVAEAVKKMPLDDLLLETDAPYLTPVPYRGKRNEPAYLSYISEKIASLKEVDVNQVREQTVANAERLFML